MPVVGTMAAGGKRCRPHNHGNYVVRDGKAYCRQCGGYIGHVVIQEAKPTKEIKSK